MNVDQLTPLGLGPDLGPGVRKRKTTLRIGVLIVCLIVLFAGLYTLGYLPRNARAKRVEATAARTRSLPVVPVVKVRQASPEVELSLPGSIEAALETPIYARAEGYVARRLVDIGDRVKTGQLLALIESPELDYQIQEAQASEARAQASLRQAQADVEGSRANLDLARVTLERWRVLVDKGVLPKQQGDEKQSAFETRQAEVEAGEASVGAWREAVQAARAGVSRLQEMKGFRSIHAPFSGVVVARNVEVGALVTPGSSSSQRELFRLAQVDPLKVTVEAPQSSVRSVSPGQKCTVTVEEFPGRTFEGLVTRTAGALDSGSRTLLTEIEVRNTDGALLPGMYATAHLIVRNPNPPLVIPASSVEINDKGPVVACLDEENRVRFQKVRLGRDYGSQIEVVQGLRAGQRIATTLNDQIREGIVVQPTSPVSMNKANSTGTSK